MRTLVGGAATIVLVAAGSLLIATPSHAAPNCSTTSATTTCTFPYTGASETWQVPAGVVAVDADVTGASGGSISTFTLGGVGGRAQASLPVAPGSELQVTVGGRGASIPGCDNSTTSPGGFNGGGDGGGTLGGCTGAGGGGATDIRSGGTALTDRVLVAGGGGGSANGIDGNGPFYGGAGGGLVGQTGGPASGGVGVGGRGGDQSGGGSGQLGLGQSGTPTAGFAGGAGGGGGGYYGGAGGSAFMGTTTTSYGGGGGSGFGPSGTVFSAATERTSGTASLSFPTVTLSDVEWSSLTSSSTVVTVQVNTNGRENVPIRLLYGTAPDALTSSVVLGTVSGTTGTSLSADLTGLTAETRYFARVDVDGDATVNTVDSEFSTTEAEPTQTPEPTQEPTSEPTQEPTTEPTATETPDATPTPSTDTTTSPGTPAPTEPTPSASTTAIPAAVAVTDQGSPPAALARTGAASPLLWGGAALALALAGLGLRSRVRSDQQS